ncbi:MAG TPA: metal-dependent hydrolase [Methanotrichaceae archaeon]|nr:metal-dependent hydrolase [Methanotrichaceae archaeon]
MLVFAHLGLTLAAAQLFKRWNPDLALVALGSLLPDIIDKPLGYLVFGTPGMGRTIAHTLLFLICLATMAILFNRRELCSLSGGVLAHLILDSMWKSPVTLLWPLLGRFPIVQNIGTIDYLAGLMHALYDPYVSVPEVLGLAYLVYFCWSRRLAFASWAESRLQGRQISKFRL